MLRLKLKKAMYCVLHPGLWRALFAGVAPSIEHRAALGSRTFKTIVDVGANRGQFALFARLHNPDAQIYAFEPQKAASELFEALFKGDRRAILQRTAIGSSVKEAPIYVADEDDSSSLLRPLSNNHDIFGTTATTMESTIVRPLDDCLSSASIERPALLKIDVEGAELDVLMGSSTLLSQFDAVYVECSYIALHENQALAYQVVDLLQSLNFRIAGVYNQHEFGQLGAVQADLLFFRD